MRGSNPMIFVKNMVKLINPFFDIMREAVEILVIAGVGHCEKVDFVGVFLGDLFETAL